MEIQGMLKKITVTAVAVVIAAGASGFAAARASADTLQSTVSASQGSSATSSEAQIPAVGSIVSTLVYNHIHVKIDGHSLNGDGGGLMTPGGGWLKGSLFSNDFPRLFQDTASYQINAVGPYTNINFFDSYSHLLGHLQAGSVSTVVGIGGGKASWS